MQIQGTGEIGSTKRNFHLSGVPRIESRLYFKRQPWNVRFWSNLPPLFSFTLSFSLLLPLSLSLCPFPQIPPSIHLAFFFLCNKVPLPSWTIFPLCPIFMLRNLFNSATVVNCNFVFSCIILDNIDKDIPLLFSVHLIFVSNFASILLLIRFF